MVNNRGLVAFLITFLLGIIGIIIFPYYTINPGVVIEDHLRLKNDCLSCHSLGEGAQTKKCIECHQLSIIGLKYVNGEKRKPINSKSNFLHNSIVNIHCVDCHTEHKGLSRENATINFRHQVLRAELQKECTNCHSPQKPKDEIHMLLEVQCSDCHNTSGWIPSHFIHELLGDRKNDCRSCHENKRPGDNLHKQIGKDVQCIQCHNTQAWKPSTFDHNKYFRFDSNHPSNCSDCHNVSTSFKTYSCYNCHEHNPARIQKEHFKEGIRNFTNCVECHRSGDEDEVINKENKRKGRDN
jgi:hypothetical protein